MTDVRWRVECDGLAHHTKVYDGQGNLVPLDGVVAIHWHADSSDGLARLTIEAEASIAAAGKAT